MKWWFLVCGGGRTIHIILSQNKSKLCACKQLSLHMQEMMNQSGIWGGQHEWRKAKAEWSYELKLFTSPDITSILSRRKMNTIILAKRTIAWKIRMQISTRKLRMISCCRIIVFFPHCCCSLHCSSERHAPLYCPVHSSCICVPSIKAQNIYI